MAYTTVLNRNNWPAGKHSFGPYPIATGVTRLNARMARFERLGNGNRKNGTEWPDIRDAQNVQQNVINYFIEMSYNSGGTWFPVGGGTSVGGIIVASPGLGAPPEEVEYYKVSLDIDSDTSNSNRMLRGWIETYTALATIVEVELI